MIISGEVLGAFDKENGRKRVLLFTHLYRLQCMGQFAGVEVEITDLLVLFGIKESGIASLHHGLETLDEIAQFRFLKIMHPWWVLIGN